MDLQKFKGRKILLGVCSSIAAYKAVDLASTLVKAGAEVRVIMTKNASKIISERVFATVSRSSVCVDMWERVDDWKPEHVSFAQFAELFIIAPATANSIGNFANGLAPDMLSSTYLATKAKVLIAPAMNDAMYSHPAVQKNIAQLKNWGVEFVEPDDGALACGTCGKGRLAELGLILSRAAELL